MRSLLNTRSKGFISRATTVLHDSTESRYVQLETTTDEEEDVSISLSPLHGIDTETEIPVSSSTEPVVPTESINLWTSTTCFLPLSYLMVGSFQGLSSGVMTMFLLSINASEAQQLTIKSLRSLPAILKIVFGFISDAYPIFGYRRKIYMIIGWTCSSVSMLGLSLCGDSIPWISLFYFLFGLGFWMADVVSDSVMVEMAKSESDATKGQLSSQCYSYRFLMNMITVAIATFTYDYISVYSIFYVLAILPWVVMMPAIYYMYEDKNIVISTPREQLSEIWETVCSQAVWQPMAFVYIYQLFQIGNAAWTQFLYSNLHFSSLQINSFIVVGYVLLYLGTQVYRSFLIKYNWRTIYIWLFIMSIFVSLLQILLLLKVNRQVGISDYLFCLGDDVFGDFLGGIQFLPTMIMMTNLCPTGSEGASFAIFTTVNNSAMLLGGSISTLLLGIWDVSKEALERDDLSGMIKLTLLTTALQLFPIVFLRYLPSSVDEMKVLAQGIRSSMGGAIFLAVIGVSVVGVLLNSLLNILAPGWAGES